MVCWILIMQALRLKPPEDKESFEEELMKELRVDRHEEIKPILDRLSDEAKVRLFTRIMKKKKKAKERYLEDGERAYA